MKENKNNKNLGSAIVKFFDSFRDVKKLGVAIFLAIVLLMTWSGVKVVESNYELQKQLSKLQQQVELDKLKNDNLKLKNDYYKTDSYLEQSARSNLGLARPGETEVIIPRDVALAHLTEDTSKESVDLDNGANEKSNLELWLDFLFHRE